MPVDVTTLAVIRGALETIALEMDNTLPMAAFSTSIAEGCDYADGIYTKTGEVVVQGQESLPMFMAMQQYSLQKSLEIVDINEISPGDIYVVNDVYVGGCHLMDVRLFQPFYFEDELCLFLSNVGHWLDIGGNVAGGYNPQATEIFQEGLRIPPVKVYSQGKLNKDIVSMITRNVRTPKEAHGDLMAQIKAIHVGESRLNELFQRYGSQLVLESIDELKIRSERQMRSYIREIPDGVYTFTDCLDNDGVREEPMVINLKMEVKGDEIHFDFSGSSELSAGFANIVETITRTSCFFTMKHIFPDVPINSGCFEPISFTIPDGIFVNSTSPHATGLNPEICTRVSDAVFGVFAQAIPEKSFAASHGTSNHMTIAGNDPLKGNYLVYAFWGGGLGGHAHGDGLTHGNHPPTSAKTQPIEVYEQRFPFLFNRFAVREGSAGPGKFRGGLGMEFEMEILRGEASSTHTGDRGVKAPFGINGGKESQKNELKYYLGGKEFIPPRVSKVVGVKMQKGDKIIVRTPGGGGYGNPFERDVDLVLKDVKRKYITIDSAEKDYGVAVVKKDNILQVDHERTAQLRGIKSTR